MAKKMKENRHKGKVLVDLIESETGWGQRIDETKEFDNFDEAKEYCDAFNASNNEDVVPSWYMFARIRNLSSYT